MRKFIYVLSRKGKQLKKFTLVTPIRENLADNIKFNFIAISFIINGYYIIYVDVESLNLILLFSFSLLLV